MNLKDWGKGEVIIIKNRVTLSHSRISLNVKSFRRTCLDRVSHHPEESYSYIFLERHSNHTPNLTYCIEMKVRSRPDSRMIPKSIPLSKERRRDL